MGRPATTRGLKPPLVAVLPHLIGKEGESIHCKSHELLLSSLSPLGTPLPGSQSPLSSYKTLGAGNQRGGQLSPKRSHQSAIRMQLLEYPMPHMYQCD
jgi:hypothetical protein